MSRLELIKRALQEDHAAIKARCKEARVAHRALADLMRQKADELLNGDADIEAGNQNS